MKYIKALKEIRDFYKDVNMYRHVRNKHTIEMMRMWGFNNVTNGELEQSHNAMRYLVGCHTGEVEGFMVEKPSIDVIIQCFKRYLDYLKAMHNCDSNTVGNKSPVTQNQYKACTYYTLKCQQPDWYENLPDTVKGDMDGAYDGLDFNALYPSLT